MNLSGQHHSSAAAPACPVGTSGSAMGVQWWLLCAVQLESQYVHFPGCVIDFCFFPVVSVQVCVDVLLIILRTINHYYKHSGVGEHIWCLIASKSKKLTVRFGKLLRALEKKKQAKENTHTNTPLFKITHRDGVGRKAKSFVTPRLPDRRRNTQGTASQPSGMLGRGPPCQHSLLARANSRDFCPVLSWCLSHHN